MEAPATRTEIRAPSLEKDGKETDRQRESGRHPGMEQRWKGGEGDEAASPLALPAGPHLGPHI